MKSPFPGVDPYIEAQGKWPDFHLRFLNYLCESIAELLPESYDASLHERTSVIDLASRRVDVVEPDIGVSRSIHHPPVSKQTATVLEDPSDSVELLLPEEFNVRETFIEIHHRSNRQLVTVVELLSPSNKSSPGFGQYESKRAGIHQSDVHRVEIDLLLTGRRLSMRQPLPAGDFYIFVSDAARRPKCDVRSWTLTQRIPPVAIPLKSPDGAITIDLAAVFQTAYERGRYERSLDYTQSLDLPLTQSTREWCENIASKRSA
jgi:hypothetical protein